MKKLGLLVFILLPILSYSQTITSSGGGTGNWNDPNSWSPATVPTAANSTSVIIANTHTITVTAILTIDQVSIQNGGTLVINTGITLTLGTGAGDDINVNAGGTLNVNGTIQLVAGIGGTANRLRVFGTVNNNGSFLNSNTTKFIFEAGSNYVHVFDGTTANAIPPAAYNVTSTVTISGFGVGGATPPTGLGQTFGGNIYSVPTTFPVLYRHHFI